MSRTTALSVNLNKVALLRNTRPIDVPSVERAAHIALDVGAAGITVHPRPDGRHILVSDVLTLSDVVRSYAGREFNIEGNPFSGPDEAGPGYDYPGFMQVVRRAVRAGGVHQVTLVPDAPDQATSNHGWRLDEWHERLLPVVDELHELGCRVSLFVEPEPEAMKLAAGTGAERVELYTEPFARAFEGGDARDALAAYAAAARSANGAGLGVNAGHDLNLENLKAFLASVPHVTEVSIGHGLVADALWMGLGAAVRAYIDVLEHASGHVLPARGPATGTGTVG